KRSCTSLAPARFNDNPDAGSGAATGQGTEPIPVALPELGESSSAGGGRTRSVGCQQAAMEPNWSAPPGVGWDALTQTRGSSPGSQRSGSSSAGWAQCQPVGYRSSGRDQAQR